MRSTVIGVVLAVAFLAAMFALSQMQPHVSAPLYAQAAQDVKPGFVGAKRIGRWILICGKPTAADAAGSKNAIPFSLNPDPKSSAATAAAAQNPVARCLATFQIPQKNNPKALLMGVNFRYSLDQKRLAMTVRFPAVWAQKGDDLVIALDKKPQFKLPVRECVTGSFCTASGFLDQTGQSLILNSTIGTVVFPAQKGAKPLIARVPLLAVHDALAAARRAES
jgi:hypothetical protein